MPVDRSGDPVEAKEVCTAVVEVVVVVGGIATVKRIST